MHIIKSLKAVQISSQNIGESQNYQNLDASTRTSRRLEAPTAKAGRQDR